MRWRCGDHPCSSKFRFVNSAQFCRRLVFQTDGSGQQLPACCASTSPNREILGLISLRFRQFHHLTDWFWSVWLGPGTSCCIVCPIETSATWDVQNLTTSSGDQLNGFEVLDFVGVHGFRMWGFLSCSSYDSNVWNTGTLKSVDMIVWRRVGFARFVDSLIRFLNLRNKNRAQIVALGSRMWWRKAWVSSRIGASVRSTDGGAASWRIIEGFNG
jgi:hypothetical protein